MSQPNDERKYDILITGLTPLVMHNNTSIGAERERDPLAHERAHFMDKTYRDHQGHLIIPGRAIKKMAMMACKFLPDKPKGTQMKSYAALVQGAMIIEEEAILDVDISKVVAWEAVVNGDPSKGPRGPKVIRVRPLIPLPWSAQTRVAVYDDLLSHAMLSKIMDAAGKKVGLLDGRAIDMGRCEIIVAEASA